MERLTWEGHDYLENIRQDTIWNRTKDIILEKGLVMTLGVIKTVATGLMSDMVNKAIVG